MATGRLQGINDELGPLIAAEKGKKVVEVSEDTFRHKLLPLAVARFSNVDYDLDMTHWQNITGENPTNGVRVMRGSELLFETPPLILSPEVTFEGASLLNQLKEAERREQAGLPKGDLMDEDVLRPKFGVRNLNQSLVTWIYIFRYYGIILDIVDSDGNVVDSSPDDGGAGEDMVDAGNPVRVNVDMWEDDDDDDGDVL